MMRFIQSLVIFLLMMACTSKPTKTVNQTSEDWLSKIQLSDLNDQPIDLQQFKGKTIFINFWATWCRPCIEEMPYLAQAEKLLADKNIVFLFASDEEVRRIESFQKRSQLNLHFVRVINFDELPIQVLPTTYIFNSKGALSFSESGSRKWDDPKSIELINQIIENE